MTRSEFKQNKTKAYQTSIWNIYLYQLYLWGNHEIFLSCYIWPLFFISSTSIIRKVFLVILAKFFWKINSSVSLSSVQFSHSVMSDSLGLHELLHARLRCPSPTPRVHSNSCPSSWWCHPAISFSVVHSPSAPNPSQHQSFFQWVNSSHEDAKILEFQF